ncbi:hypothetical protein K2Y11_05675 [bacterium]|nr:hypothetical protein [bacterium]
MSRSFRFSFERLLSRTLLSHGFGSLDLFDHVEPHHREDNKAAEVSSLESKSDSGKGSSHSTNESITNTNAISILPEWKDDFGSAKVASDLAKQRHGEDDSTSDETDSASIPSDDASTSLNAEVSVFDPEGESSDGQSTLSSDEEDEGREKVDDENESGESHSDIKSDEDHQSGSSTDSKDEDEESDRDSSDELDNHSNSGSKESDADHSGSGSHEDDEEDHEESDLSSDEENSDREDGHSDDDESLLNLNNSSHPSDDAEDDEHSSRDHDDSEDERESDDDAEKELEDDDSLETVGSNSGSGGNSGSNSGSDRDDEEEYDSSDRDIENDDDDDEDHHSEYSGPGSDNHEPEHDEANSSSDADTVSMDDDSEEDSEPDIDLKEDDASDFVTVPSSNGEDTSDSNATSDESLSSSGEEETPTPIVNSPSPIIPVNETQTNTPAPVSDTLSPAITPVVPSRIETVIAESPAIPANTPVPTVTSGNTSETPVTVPVVIAPPSSSTISTTAAPSDSVEDHVVTSTPSVTPQSSNSGTGSTAVNGSLATSSASSSVGLNSDKAGNLLAVSFVQTSNGSRTTAPVDSTSTKESAGLAFPVLMSDAPSAAHAARPQSVGSEIHADQEEPTSGDSESPPVHQHPDVMADAPPSVVALEVARVPASQSWLTVPQWLIDSLSSLESSDIVPSTEEWEQVWEDAQALVTPSSNVFSEQNSFSWLMAGGVAATAIIYRRSVASKDDKRAWLELSPGLIDDVFIK